MVNLSKFYQPNILTNEINISCSEAITKVLSTKIVSDNSPSFFPPMFCVTNVYVYINVVCMCRCYQMVMVQGKP